MTLHHQFDIPRLEGLIGILNLLPVKFLDDGRFQTNCTNSSLPSLLPPLGIQELQDLHLLHLFRKNLMFNLWILLHHFLLFMPLQEFVSKHNVFFVLPMSCVTKLELVLKLPLQWRLCLKNDYEVQLIL